jgi:hypothetical protein
MPEKRRRSNPAAPMPMRGTLGSPVPNSTALSTLEEKRRRLNPATPMPMHATLPTALPTPEEKRRRLNHAAPMLIHATPLSLLPDKNRGLDSSLKRVHFSAATLEAETARDDIAGEGQKWGENRFAGNAETVQKEKKKFRCALKAETAHKDIDSGENLRFSPRAETVTEYWDTETVV